MAHRELEAVIWCPKCRVDKFELWRQLISHGHYEHVTVPPSLPPEAHKRCECGTNLERRR